MTSAATAPAEQQDVPRPALRSGGRSLHRWVPSVAALLVYAAAVLDLVSALTRASRPRVQQLTQHVPGALTHAATAATAVTGVLLLLLAHALRRRKQRAWRVVVVLLAGSVVLHVAKGLDVEEAAVSALLLAGLIAYRRDFYARGDPRTRWRALVVLLQLAVLSVVVGFVLVRIRLGVVVGRPSLLEQLQHVLLGLVGVEGPVRFRYDRSADIVSFTLGALGALTVLVPAYLVLRPAEPQPLMTEDDERRLRELLARQGGRDSLGYFALRRDKSVVWSPTGKAAIAYRVLSGVALASGDPIGDPEAWPGALAEFLSLAAEHAWVPAVMGCGEQGGTAYRRAGLQVLEIGDEAVVEVAGFTLEGRPMRGVRQAVNRVERAGYTTVMRRVADISEEERAQIREAASSWRAGGTERGFSMALGRFGEPEDDCCVLVTAEQGGVLRGLLHFVPWGSDGLSLDLMRRDRAADNGVNELLIVRAIQAAPQLGVRRLSLNFAVFRAALERGERLGAGPVIRGWRWLLLFVSRWFQIESLYRFNAKFRPKWEPRYVCYPSARDLPRVALAALEAEAFLVWPRLPLAPGRQPLARLLRAVRPAVR
jgi:lysyl-tRNA synthetase class 2